MTKKLESRASRWLGIFILIAVPLQAGAQTTRIQFVNAAPDLALATVDIYANGELVVDDLPYAKATAEIELPLARTTFAVAPSTSTSVADAYAEIKTWVHKDIFQYVVVTGVLSPDDYPSNPEGLATNIAIQFVTNGSRSIPSDEFRIRALHASPDAPRLDFWIGVFGDPPFVLRRNMSFRSVSGIDQGTAGGPDGGGYEGFLTASGQEWPREINFIAGGDWKSAGGKSFLEIPIGFFGDEGPPSRRLRWMLVNEDGTTGFTRFTRPTRVQFISAAVDPGLRLFDLYVDGFLVKDDFAYRGCTPMLSLTSGRPMTLAIAPFTSTSAEEAVYTQTVQFGQSSIHQAVLAGVLEPDVYPPNPAGVDISLKAFVNSNTRLSADQGNFNFRLFHGRIDLGAVDLWDTRVDYYRAVDDLVFGEFSGYSVGTADTKTGVLTSGDGSEVLGEDRSNFSVLSGKTALSVLADNLRDEQAFSFVMYTLDGTEYQGTMSTAVDEEAGIPSEFHLAANYPNPFNPNTVIEFDVPSAAAVRLEVFDLLGRQVSLLVDGVMEPGTHRISWQAAGNVPSGNYLYRISTPGWTSTRILTLLK